MANEFNLIVRFNSEIDPQMAAKFQAMADALVSTNAEVIAAGKAAAAELSTAVNTAAAQVAESTAITNEKIIAGEVETQSRLTEIKAKSREEEMAANAAEVERRKAKFNEMAEWEARLRDKSEIDKQASIRRLEEGRAVNEAKANASIITNQEAMLAEYNKIWDAALLENSKRRIQHEYDIGKAQVEASAEYNKRILTSQEIFAREWSTIHDGQMAKAKEVDDAYAENNIRNSRAIAAAEAERLKGMRLVNTMRSTYFKQTEEEAYKINAAIDALAAKRVFTALGNDLTDLHGRLSALSPAVRQFGSRFFTTMSQSTSVARTFSNSINRQAAMFFNIGNAASRAANMLSEHGRVVGQVTTLTDAYVRAQNLATAADRAKEAAMAKLIPIEEAQKAKLEALNATTELEGMIASSQRAAAAMNVLKYSFIGLGAAAIGVGAGLIYAGEKAAKYAEQIGDVATETGFTTQNISATALAGKEAGISFEQVSKSLTFFARGLGETGSQGDRFHKTLQALGVTSKDVNVAFEQVVEKLGRAKGSAAETADAMNLFRRAVQGGGEDTVKLLKVIESMPGGMKAWRAEAERMGLEVLPSNVEEARKLLTAQRELTAQFQAIVVSVGQEVIPTLTDLTAVLINSGHTWDTVKYSVEGVYDTLGAAVKGMQAVSAAASGQFKLAGQYWNDAKKFADDSLDSAVKSAKAWDDYGDGLMKTHEHLQAVADGLNNLKGIDAPEILGKSTAAFTDKLGEMLTRIKEVVAEEESNDLPAKQKITNAIQKQIQTADEYLKKDADLLRLGKINLTEYENAYREHTEIIRLLNEKLFDDLGALDIKNNAKRMAAAVKAAKEEEQIKKDQMAAMEATVKAGWAAMARDAKQAQDQISADAEIVTKQYKTLEEELKKIDEATKKSTKAFDNLSTPIGTHVRIMRQAIAVYHEQIAASEKMQTQALSEANAIKTAAYAQQAAARTDLEKALASGAVMKAEQAYADTVRRTSAAVIAARKAEKQAEEDALAAGAAGIVGAIAGRRAQAAVEAAYDTAQGFAHLGAYDFWGAAQYFIAAAEMGIVAGTGGGGRGSAGGGSSRSTGRERGTGTLTYAQQQQILAAGAQEPPPSGTLHVIVMGEPNAAAYLTNMINNHVRSRDGNLTSTASTRRSTVSTGRH